MHNYKLSLLGLVLLALVGCSTEAVDNQQENAITQLETQLDVTADAQQPAEVFDNTKEGIYHGVIASGETQSRGKVWLNLGNNTEYTATITMVDGSISRFTGVKVNEDEITSYFFSGDTGSFKVTENTINRPEITEVILNETSYFMYAVKSTSQRMAVAYTGTFRVIQSGDETGTWNILANGATDPNLPFGGGIAITDVMVTYNGTTQVDTNIETGNFTCFGSSNWVPTADLNGPNDGIIAFDQESSFFGGNITWNLAYSLETAGGSPTYFNADCTPRSNGNPFFHTSNSNPDLVRIGIIDIDLL